MRSKLFGIILGTTLLLAGAGAAKADEWCARQIRHERHELNEAIRHHGFYSWQANRERRELDRVLDRCSAR
jgi:hypothetical protein